MKLVRSAPSRGARARAAQAIIRVPLHHPEIVVDEHTHPEAPGSLPRSRPGLRLPSKPGMARLGFLPAAAAGPFPEAPTLRPGRPAPWQRTLTATTTLASTRHGQRRPSRGLRPRAPGPHHGSDREGDRRRRRRSRHPPPRDPSGAPARRRGQQGRRAQITSRARFAAPQARTLDVIEHVVTLGLARRGGRVVRLPTARPRRCSVIREGRECQIRRHASCLPRPLGAAALRQIYFHGLVFDRRARRAAHRVDISSLSVGSPGKYHLWIDDSRTRRHL